MSTIVYPCGCRFNVDDGKEESVRRDQLKELPLGINVNIYDIPLDCPHTWHLIAQGHTKGVFQLEAQLGQTWAKHVSPGDLEDLGALVALLRPGCLKAMSGDPPKSMTQRYCDRKSRTEDVEFFGIPELEPILKKTYGVLVYQEQAMKIAVALAGFNEQEADVLRKAIGKKKPEIMAKVEKGFLEGCTIKGIVTPERAAEVFGWIRESQKYSFNKSHAVCYGLDGYWSAYCKCHFPEQFYCSYLRGAAWKQDTYEEIRELVADAKLHDVRVNPPDFRDVQRVFYIKNNENYFGLMDLRDIGEAAFDKVQKNTREVRVLLDKQLAEWSWMDYLIYFADRISSTTNVAMISSGALDFMGMPRNYMLYELDIWNKLTDKERDWVQRHQYYRFCDDCQNIAEWSGPHWHTLCQALEACTPVSKEGGGCRTAKRSEVLKSLVSLLKEPPHTLTDSPHNIAWFEEQYLGTPISCTFVDGCEDSVRANCTCKDIMNGYKGYTVLAVGINRVKEILTREKKAKMAFISVSDSSCHLDSVVCFPKEWIRYKDILQVGNTVLLHGEIDSKGKGSFIVKEVWQI